ncbi:MAG TPA: SDR family oxidoreductase [Opitutaceae bacterium]|nr:SDR family oxidoreductase [Opitutaceae bacterium]
MKHENKIALVTGGSRGLGRSTALQLARSGADIVLTYRQKKQEGEAVLAEIQSLGRRATLLQLDVAHTAHFAAFHDTVKTVLDANFGRKNFDFLINNAGNDAYSPFVQTTEANFDSLMSVHFKGVFFLTQSLLPLLADGGRIVNTSTGLTRFAIPGYAAYASMKGAVEVLTKYLAKELGSRGITVNLVAPGIIETDFTRQALSQPGAKEFFASNIALGRVGVPEDIAGVVDFLCSTEGRWVTAQRVEASGGMLL